MNCRRRLRDIKDREQMMRSRIPRLDHDRANVKHDVGSYLLLKKQNVRLRFPAPFYRRIPISLPWATNNRIWLDRSR